MSVTFAAASKLTLLTPVKRVTAANAATIGKKVEDAGAFCRT